MSADPVLVFQSRRLGDLVLTFPLLRQLALQFPASPVWLVGQKKFLTSLGPFLPDVRLLDLATCAEPGGNFAAVLNLDTNPRAARLAERVKSPCKAGALASARGMRIAGFWQLYRASLTQNNRHNTFHWADLNRLDLPAARLAPTCLRPAGSGRIGIFLGASEAAKRPDAGFWLELARILASRGFAPLLLGGPAEAETGKQLARGTGAASFAGRTSLPQLAGLLKTLDLLITPDTGPMHLADWLGVPVLNLSMGNVAPSETGPYSPGQYVLRAAMSCAGCWSCGRGRLYCKRAFDARIAARAAEAIARQKPLPALPRLELLRSGRDADGLYRLDPASGHDRSCRILLDSFWHAAFLHFADPARPAPVAEAAGLALRQPQVARSLLRNLGDMLASLSASLRRGRPLPEQFWRQQPWHSRLFAGHAQMTLQNDNFAPATFAAILARIARLKEIFSAGI